MWPSIEMGMKEEPFREGGRAVMSLGSTSRLLTTQYRSCPRGCLSTSCCLLLSISSSHGESCEIAQLLGGQVECKKLQELCIANSRVLESRLTTWVHHTFPGPTGGNFVPPGPAVFAPPGSSSR